MSVYEISFIFNAESDKEATYLAENLQDQVIDLLAEEPGISDVKIAFNKFSEESDAQQ